MIPRVLFPPTCRNTANSLCALAAIALCGVTASGLRAGETGDAVATAVAAPAAAAKIAEPYDLGEGLSYVRVRRFADDGAQLLSALQTNTALIVDCRYTADLPSDAEALAQAFAARKPDAFLALLATTETGKIYLVLSGLNPKLITLTPSGASADPRIAIVVAQPADVDRRAYDALDGGMPLEALITGKIEKERFDEAELVKEFENGNANAAPPPEPDPTQKPATEKAPVLTDRVLQRAVNLHRALSALKRD